MVGEMPELEHPNSGVNLTPPKRLRLRRRWFLLATAWIGLLVLDMRFPFGFAVHSLCVAFLLLISAPCAIVQTIVRRIHRRRRIPVYSAIVFVLAISNLWAASRIGTWKRARSQENAHRLIAALE